MDFSRYASGGNGLPFVDAAPKEDFDRLTRLATFISGAPVGAITLVDGGRQRCVSLHGITVPAMAEPMSFCAKTLALGQPLVIEDARLHAEFATDPSVAGALGLRFYAGIPLISPTGRALGTLSVMDTEPRQLESQVWEALNTLAQQVMLTLELVRQRTQLEQIALGRAHSIVASAASGISMASADGRMVLVNPALCQMLGYAEHELLERSFMDITHPDDRAPTGALVHALLAGERDSFVLDKRHMRKNGNYLWTSVRVSRIDLAESRGMPASLIAVIEDISSRKAMEEQLRAKDMLLTMAGQMARVGGWRLDLRTDTLIWSEEVRSIHQVPPGWSPSLDEALNFYAPEWRSLIQERVARCIETGQTFDEELELITAAGKRLWVRALGQAERDTKGNVQAVQGAFQDISDRKALVTLVTQRQHQFRQFADAMPLIVWTAAAGGHIDYANQMLSQYTGLSNEALMNNQRMLEIIHPEDMNPGVEVWRAALQEGHEYSNEFRIRSASGVFRWHLMRAVPLRDENNQIIKWCGTAIDIHDRKNSEETMRRLSERLVTTLESITDAFFTLDQEWRFTYLNHEAERLLYRSREELLGKTMWEEFPEALDSIFETHYRMAMNEKAKVSFEGFYAPLGDWFRIHAYPSVEGLTVYFQSITHQRAAEEQLRLLETCVAHMSDIVIITEAEPQDEPGPRILFVNNAFEERTGYTRNEVLGRSPRFLQGPKTQRSELQRIRDAMERWQPVRAEIINYTKSGEEFWLELDVVPISDEKGWFTHWVSVERDITERKQAEAERARIIQLEQSQKLAELASQTKSHFLATMSHEIRTPISGVLGMVDVLHQTSLHGEQVEMVEVLRDSAQSLLGIIDDILDFSKIEAGKLELESAPINLFSLMKSVASLQDRFAENKRVELFFYFDPALPENVLGDALRMRQILLNLLNNAIKFSSGQERMGQVSFRAQLVAQRGDHVSVDFVVEDNGIGIPPESVEQLFTPFTQADSSTTRIFGGTGLGLAISRHLVDLMGGDIHVDSMPGAGAIFRVRLSFQQHEPDQRTTSRYQLADIKGLSCMLLGQSRLMDDLASYLRADEIDFQRMESLPAVSPGEDDDRLWVIDLSAVSSFESLSGVRQLLIDRGRRRRPRQLELGQIHIDGNLLDRYSFYDGLALLAGREPGYHRREVQTLGSRHIPPSRLQALAQGRLLLVAEDNETNQKVISHQLSTLGYCADIAGDGEVALELWRKGHYALLLTDLHMPRMDGYKLTREIRKQEAGRGYLPIIALSANVVQGAAEECRSLGMDAYLTKPVSLTELQNTLEQWLPRRAAPVEIVPVISVGADPHLDLTQLAALVGDDPDVLADFLQSYYSDVDTMVKSLRQASEACDLAAINAIAHKLKSSSRAVGALKLGDLAAELEQLALAANTEELTTVMSNFELEFAAVCTFCQKYLASKLDD